MAESAMSDILDAFNSWVTLDYSGDHGEAAMAARERALEWIADLETEQSRLAVENQSLRESGRQAETERDSLKESLRIQEANRVEAETESIKVWDELQRQEAEVGRLQGVLERIHAIADDPTRALGRWLAFRTLGEIRDMVAEALANQSSPSRIGCTHCEGDSVCSKCGQVKIKDDDGATD